MKRAHLKSFVPFGAPRISASEKAAIRKTLESGWIGTGPKTKVFEKQFKKYVGSKEAVAVSSCTAALHLSLSVCGIEKGNEVITTPLTFVATANAIMHTGAKVVFADVEDTTLNIDPQEVNKRITQKTKAILPVHFGGLPVNLDALETIARKKRLPIIEDAAHAVGARYKGKKIGSSGNFVCFSFYPNKNITTIEGGMITLPSGRQAEMMRVLAMHGLDSDAWKRYSNKFVKVSLAVAPGYKYNLPDVHAVLGIEQLKKIEAWQKKRETFARIYDNTFAKMEGVQLQFRPKDVSKNRHALHLYTLRLSRSQFSRGSREKVVQELLRRNIGASIHYVPVHLHPYFKKLGYRKGDFPVAERIGEEIFTLPLTPHLSSRTIRTIAHITKTVIERYR